MNINLKTSDGDVFKVNSALLRYSGTLKYMLDVCGVQDTVIPLPRVNSKILRKLLDWVHHQEEMRGGKNVPMETEETPALPNDLTVDVSPGLLYHMIFTANFLGYEALLENILTTLIDWMEQNPIETFEESNIPERITSVVQCYLPSGSLEDLRGIFGEKVERVVKPMMEQIIELFREKEIVNRLKSFNAEDAHELYNDAKKLIQFFKNELSETWGTNSLEQAFKESKVDWSRNDFLKNSLTQELKELDNELQKNEKTDLNEFLDRFNLSRASWTFVEIVQIFFSFSKDLAQHSIVSSMTNSRTLGGILAVGNKILLSEMLNTFFSSFTFYLTESNYLKGLDTLVGRTSFFNRLLIKCENMPSTQIIKLQTSNGAIFDTNVKYGDCQEIMKILFKVAGFDENGVVPLPYLNQVVFEKILAWANYYKQTDNTSIFESGLTRWENQYFRVDMRTLFELIWAADYLDIPALLEAACQAVGVSMIGPTPDDIMNVMMLAPDIMDEFHNMLERHFHLYT